MSRKNTSIYVDNKVSAPKMIKKYTNREKAQKSSETSLKTIKNEKADELKILKDELYQECIRLRELVYRESKRKGAAF